MAACYAVENSAVDPVSGRNYQADPTNNARVLRNLTLGVEFIMSHLAHFYALSALDYVQGPTAFAGIPQSGPWSPDFNSSYYFNAGNVLNGLLNLYLAGAPLTPADQVSLLQTDTSGLYAEVIGDYTIALRLAKMAGDLMGILGGRWPMYSNLVCGGVTHPNLTSTEINAFIDLAVDYLYRGSANAAVTPWNGPEGPVSVPGTSISPAQGTILHFIQEHYIPTVQIVAAVYSNFDNPKGGLKGLQMPGGSWDGNTYAGLGYGAGCGNFLSWGAFHTSNDGHTPPNVVAPMDPGGHYGDKTYHPDHLLNTGVWIGGTGGALEPGSELSLGYADPIGLAQACAKEFITSSKYRNNPVVGSLATTDYSLGLGPNNGYTDPDKNKAGAYSWIKSPRIVGDSGAHVNGSAANVVEVGPLARMICSNKYDIVTPGATQAFLPPDPTNRPVLNAVYQVITTSLGLAGQPLGLSTMDRHRARALEALEVANEVPVLIGSLDGSAFVDSSWAPPTTGTNAGWGTNEAPRGALLHYNEHSQNRITKYQCIVPTTWNASPRHTIADDATAGPIENAIMNPPVAHTGATSTGRGGAQTVPVEMLRVVHSFDPCIACAVHKVDKKKKAEKLNTKKEVRRR